MVYAHNLQPGLSHDGDNVVVHLYGAPAELEMGFADTAGFQRWGQLGSPGDQSFSVNPETEDIEVGSPMSAADTLLMKLTGQLDLVICDLNPHALEKSMGTDIPKEVTYNATWNTGAGSAIVSATTKKLTLTTGEASGLAKNDMLEVQLPSKNGGTYPQYSKVIAVNGDEVTLKWHLETEPQAGATVKLVDSLIIHHGGSSLVNQSLLLQLDFPKGYQHNLLVYNAQANGGVTRQLAGAVKTPSKWRMLSHLMTINTKNYLVLASTQIKNPNAA